jgi:hypothetical protein
MEYLTLLDGIITKDEIDKIQMGGAATAATTAATASDSYEKGKITNPPTDKDDPFATASKSNNGLLRLINDDVDNIIRKIKSVFGDNIINVNKGVSYIIKYLTKITDDINEKLEKNLSPAAVSDTINYNNRVIINQDTTTGEYKEESQDNYLKLNNIEIKNLYRNNDEHMKNLNDLDTKTESYIGLYTNKLHKTDLQNSSDTLTEDYKDATAEQINTRLENCQLLEMLYLIKHEELMKTFAFTLNLFDKYKYAIKLLLYILKHLVANQNECDTKSDTPTGIKLPAPLIPNIKKLLEDQFKVQEIINSMKTDGLTSFIKTKIDTNSDTKINNDLEDENFPMYTPPAPAAAAPATPAAATPATPAAAAI